MPMDGTTSTERQHVYIPTLRNPAVLIGWLLYAVLVSALYYVMPRLPLTGTSHQRSFFGALIWSLFFTGFIMWQQMKGTSLAIDPHGLIYSRPYASLHIRWNDVEGIGVRRWPTPMFWGEGLVLRKGAPRLPWWMRPWGMGGR